MEDENDDITLDSEEGIDPVRKPKASNGASDYLDDSVVEEEHSNDTIKKLKEKLKNAEQKAREHLDNWQRAQAEFMNLRKRDEEAKTEFLKFANAKTLEDLIPVLDSFNIALSHPDTEASLGTGQGAEPIYKQLMSVLKAHGLEESNPIGEPFDPNEHEALGVIHTEKAEDDHKVLEVLQRGYKLSGKVIRPAKVRIGEMVNVQ